MGDIKNVSGRKFFVTVQIQNFVNMGLDEKDYLEPKIVSEFLLSLWKESKSGRSGACAVCKSRDGLYHVHMALYSNSKTRLLAVAKLFGNAHTDIARGDKEQLKKYILKEGEFEDKEEEILYTQGIEVIDSEHDKKIDFDYALDLLKEGKTLSKIYEDDLSLIKYDKYLREACYYVRKKEVPLIKEKSDMLRVWHFGASHTGKSYTYKKLLDQKGESEIFLVTGGSKNGFDKYMTEGAPSILFIDELRYIQYNTLLNILGYFTRTTIDCRYNDAYAFWNEVHITSVYSPDGLYKLIVPFEDRDIDTFNQLRNRLEKIVYHYRNEKGEYCTYEVDGKDYISESHFMSEFNRKFNVYKSVDSKESTPFGKE